MNYEKLSEEQRRDFTRALMNYLDTRKLSSEQMTQLLNLPASIRTRHIAQFRNGMKPFPEGKETWGSVDHVIGICDALRTTFPFSDEMRLSWIRKPHRRFKQQTPLAVMLNEGVSGLLKVRIDIDCAFGWKISEALADQHSSGHLKNH